MATGGRPPAGPGLSWDEYPFASSIQGGGAFTGVSVQAVPEEANSLQGGLLSAFYGMHDLKFGDCFNVMITP